MLHSLSGCVGDTSMRAEHSCDAQELSVLDFIHISFQADGLMNETAYLIFADVILALSIVVIFLWRF